MGSRTERLRAAQREADGAPHGITRGDEDRIRHEARSRVPTPLASHLVAVAGLLLILVDCPIVWIARSRDWNVTDGVMLLMVVLFIGGVGLVGLGAIIRDSARRRGGGG